VQNCARAPLYMSQGGHACALLKKIFKSCPDIYCSGLSEQKLPLKINRKSGNTFFFICKSTDNIRTVGS